MPFGGLLTTGIISAGSSILGGITQRGAAKRAATAQVNSANQANRFAIDRSDESRGFINEATGNADNRLEQSAQDVRDVLQPYRLAGAKGTNELSAMGEFSYNPSQLTDDPGYAFRLAEGNKALTNSIAARGGTLSGSTIKAGIGFNSGMASQEYGNAFQRALTSYNTNESRYKDLAGIGLNSAGMETGADIGVGSQIANNNMNRGSQLVGLNTHLADLYSNNITGGGNATAAGTIGAGNATAGMFSGIGQTAADVFNTYKTQQSQNRYFDLLKNLQPGAVATP